jgi:hypothetical protein
MAGMRNLLRYGAAGVLLAVLAGLAGCGSGGNPSTSASASSDAMSEEQLLTIGREYAQCLREHGIQVDEPTVERGKLRVPLVGPPPQQGTPPAQPDIPATCRSIEDRLPKDAMGRAPVIPEDIQKIERFSQCLRDNGVPEWPDPKADGSIPLNGTSVDVKSDRFQTAKKACQKYYDGPIEESA